MTGKMKKPPVTSNRGLLITRKGIQARHLLIPEEVTHLLAAGLLTRGHYPFALPIPKDSGYFNSFQ